MVQLPDKKHITIKIFGESLLLSERYIGDILDSVNFKRRSSHGGGDLFLSAVMIRDGLKINTESTGLLDRIFFKRRLKKITGLRYLKNHLSISQVNYLIEQILILEGADPDELKKKAIAMPQAQT